MSVRERWPLIQGTHRHGFIYTLSGGTIMHSSSSVASAQVDGASPPVLGVAVVEGTAVVSEVVLALDEPPPSSPFSPQAGSSRGSASRSCFMVGRR